MKKILTLIISIIFAFSMSSCMTAYAQYDDVYGTEVTYSTVITYGIPHYIDNVIAYYVYDGIYYYPYIWGGHRYFHPARRPIIGGFHPMPNHHPFGRLGEGYMNGSRNHFNGVRGNNGGMRDRGNGLAPNSSTRITGPSNGSNRGFNRPTQSQPSRSNVFTQRGNMGGSMQRSNVFSGGSHMNGGSMPRGNAGGGHFGGRR